MGCGAWGGLIFSRSQCVLDMVRKVAFSLREMVGWEELGMGIDVQQNNLAVPE